jgi:hypothetical protein
VRAIDLKLEGLLRFFTLRANSQLALGSLADRLGEEIRAISQGQVNNTSLVRAHRLKCKRHSGLSYTTRGQVSHRLELSLARGAKTVYVTNKPLARRQTSAENLVDEVLQRFEQLAGLRLQ